MNSMIYMLLYCIYLTVTLYADGNYEEIICLVRNVL